VFQGNNGLRKTGTLNRATLEAMKIPLTEYQKGIPIPPNSYAGATNTKSTGPRRIIFRATKDQIIAAQTLLRAKAMYTGEFTGKLNNETRAGLRKFQAEAGIKVTGTLNRITLEAMGIPLTEKQAADDVAGGARPRRSPAAGVSVSHRGMKTLVALILLACAATAFGQSDSRAKEQLRKVMDEQAAAWNRGDIREFMKGYWQSDDLVFV